jgi:heme exporter protein D
MFGIEDTYVWLAYALCLLSTALCVVYGAITWNRGDDSIRQEDIQWAANEDAAEKEIGGK